MKNPAHVLLIGNDGRLLNERATLLSHFWTVAAISSFDEGATHLRSADLLVLCHTITDEQREEWVASSRGTSASRPIVSLEFDDPVPTVPSVSLGVDARVSHKCGPAALVSTIYELLTERGLGSRHWSGGGHTLLAPDGTPSSMNPSVDDKERSSPVYDSVGV